VTTGVDDLLADLAEAADAAAELVGLGKQRWDSERPLRLAGEAVIGRLGDIATKPPDEVIKATPPLTSSNGINRATPRSGVWLFTRPAVGPALLTVLRTVAGWEEAGTLPWTGSWTEPSVQTVRSGPSAARLCVIRAGSADDAPGRASHNPPVVGSSPTRPTSGFIRSLGRTVDRIV